MSRKELFKIERVLDPARDGYLLIEKWDGGMCHYTPTSVVSSYKQAGKELNGVIEVLHIDVTTAEREVIRVKRANEELIKDNAKLRTKVEANIPVERIEGITKMVQAGIEMGLDANRAFNNLVKEPVGLTSRVPREKKIVSIGYLENNTPSIEDHNALKAEVAEVVKATLERTQMFETDTTLKDEVIILKAKVAELEKLNINPNGTIGSNKVVVMSDDTTLNDELASMSKRLSELEVFKKYFYSLNIIDKVVELERRDG